MNDLRIDELKKLLKRKDPYANKGDSGTLSVIAGSEYYRGAAGLAVTAAHASGVGIVRLVSIENVISAVSSLCPECIFLPVSKTEVGAISYHDLEVKKNGALKASSVLIGCGMTDRVDTRMCVASVLSSFNGAIIVDADGLNSIKNCPDLLRSAKEPP